MWGFEFQTNETVHCSESMWWYFVYVKGKKWKSPHGNIMFIPLIHLQLSFIIWKQKSSWAGTAGKRILGCQSLVFSDCYRLPQLIDENQYLQS